MERSSERIVELEDCEKIVKELSDVRKTCYETTRKCFVDGMDRLELEKRTNIIKEVCCLIHDFEKFREEILFGKSMEEIEVDIDELEKRIDSIMPLLKTYFFPNKD